MNIDIFWAVLGIGVSTVFGIWGIYLAVRYRYPGKVTMVNEQLIELFDDIGNSLPGLSVTYNNNEVSKNLVLLSAAFVNTGKLDIAPKMIEKPISISLPDGFNWLTAKIIDTSKDLNASVDIDDDGCATFSMGLFRRFEGVRWTPTIGQLKARNKLRTRAVLENFISKK